MFAPLNSFGGIGAAKLAADWTDCECKKTGTKEKELVFDREKGAFSCFIVREEPGGGREGVLMVGG